MNWEMSLVAPDHPLLRSVIPEYKNSFGALRSTAFEMWQLMLKLGGVGLAANQVGLSVRMFVMVGSKKSFSFRDGIVAINPSFVVPPNMEILTAEEGCLTYGDRRIQVCRPEVIVASWTDLKGQSNQAELIGIHARIFQHEHQHLQGDSPFFQAEPYEEDACNE